MFTLQNLFSILGSELYQTIGESGVKGLEAPTQILPPPVHVSRNESACPPRVARPLAKRINTGSPDLDSREGVICKRIELGRLIAGALS